MKAYDKKKATRQEWSKKHQHGMINRPDGEWVKGSSARDGSMFPNAVNGSGHRKVE